MDDEDKISEPSLEVPLLTNVRKIDKKKIAIAVATVVSITVLSCVGSVAYNILTNQIPYNVMVDGIKAGGMTREELASILEKKYNINFLNKTITLKAKNFTEKFSFADAKVSYDYKRAIDDAYSAGLSDEFVRRVVNYTVLKSPDINIAVGYSYDKEFINKIVESLMKKVLIPVKEYNLTFGTDKAALETGCHGESIVRDNVLALIENNIKNFKDGDLSIDIVVTQPKEIKLDEIYKKVEADPIDATTKVVDNEIRIIPQVSGREINRDELASIINTIKGKEEYEAILPVTFIEPKLKMEDVQKVLLRDELATFSTQFYTGDRNNDNRKHNITIASNKLNGKLIGAGKVFSFNDFIGPRTEDYGYLEAHSYVGGKIVDSSGGGICQVSSTLYNAALLADLEIVERTNHMFTVGYVPKGRDATVSYDGNDFRFKNSTKYPVKIESWITSDNQLFFTLVGTNENPGKSVEITSEVVDETDQPTEYIYDSKVPAGEKEVIDEGMKGYVAKAYKIVKQNGEVVKEESLGTSTYKTLPRKVKVGTKK